MQGKWSKVKIFPSEERKQSKNHCSPGKLESNKHDKKVMASRDGLGDIIDRPEKATSRLTKMSC